jgi:formamidopyrimidine-DNA glycosylase
MPEVVEVRTYADFIREKLHNNPITNITILNGRYKKHAPFELFQYFKSHTPLKVVDVKSKGKLMYFVFENDYYLLSTLGLSGGWVFIKNTENDLDNITEENYQHPFALQYLYDMDTKAYLKKMSHHLNVKFSTNEGSLYFYDMLSFGTLKGIHGTTELEKKLKTLGPDIMSNLTTFDVFFDMIKKKTNLDKEIGNVLVNQKVISGLGNYLRADILWLSKISPFRKVKDLSKSDLQKIFHNSKSLSWGLYNRKEGIKLNIISESDKIPMDYKRNFFVYMGKTDINGHEIKTDKLFEGSQPRTIHWVPEVQK